MSSSPDLVSQLRRELEETQARLAEAEETLTAIRNGEVDGLLVAGPEGEQIFTLHGSQEPYRLLIEQMSEGALTLSPEGIILYANQTFAGLLQMPLEQVIGSEFLSFVNPADQSVLTGLITTACSGNSRGMVSVRTAAGTFLPLGLGLSRLRLPPDTVLCVVATDLTEQHRKDEVLRRFRADLEQRVAERTADLSRSRLAALNLMEEAVEARKTAETANRELTQEILERKRAEAALRASEAEFRAMFEMASIGMAQADVQSGRWLRVNRKLCAITHYSEAEMLEMRVPEITHPEDREHDWQEFQRVVEGKAPDYRIEKRYVRKDGKLAWVNVNMTVIRDGSGQPTRTMATVEDITERRELEARFLRAQRLESIGQLAGGIAHDLNNVLTPILVMAPLLRSELQDPNSQSLLDSVEQAARRGADVIRRILTFSRGTELQKLPLQTRRLFEEVAGIVRETFPRSIRLDLRIPPGLWPVAGDDTQLHQVLMNLVVNARDAMPEGGVLTLAAENLLVTGEMAAHYPGAQAGPHVRWTVQDTGTGIAPEILDRIFDPFFTTKPQGQGTGLGLATVLGIVRAHEGFLEVDSLPGRGTQFHICLPVHSEAEAQICGLSPDLPAGNGRLVLLVDDEDSIRLVVGNLLSKAGYRVVTACDGDEGIQAYHQHRGQVWLALVDMMMPRSDGLTLVRAIRQADPAMKIICASGLGDEAQREKLRQLGAILFLHKPFSRDQLAAALREIGGESGAAATGTPAPATEGSPVADAVARLPAALVSGLRRAAATADYDELLALVAEVSKLEEPLGRDLRRLVENFDYPALDAVLKPDGADA